MTSYRTFLGKFELGIIGCVAVAALFSSLRQDNKKTDSGNVGQFPPMLFGETLVSTIGKPKSTDEMYVVHAFPPVGPGGSRYVTLMSQQYPLEVNDNILTAVHYRDASTKHSTGILIYSRPAQ